MKQQQRQHSTSDGSSTGKEAGTADDIPFHEHAHSETLQDLLVSKLLSRFVINSLVRFALHDSISLLWEIVAIDIHRNVFSLVI